MFSAVLAAVALVTSATPATAADILAQSRSANVYAFTFDYYFRDISREDSDAASSTADGLFNPSLNASASLLSGGSYGRAIQNTNIDHTALSFTGGGLAGGGVYVQATGSPETIGEAETTFEVTFRLQKAGGIWLYALAEAWNPGQGDPGNALATIQVINVDTGEVFLSKAAGVGEWAGIGEWTGLYAFDEFDDILELPAGKYKLVATAYAFATSGSGGEVYEEGEASFQVYGTLFENE